MGERAIIARITELLGIAEKDDCAILSVGKEYLVWTADMLHEKADFPSIATPWQMGWMSVAVNLSDIASMGAEPLGLLLAVGLAPKTDMSIVDELFAGFGDCARQYGTKILGGDLDSHEELTITGTALGRVEKDLVLKRDGAKPRDLLCVTGFLGSAGAGLRLALAEDESSKQNKLVRKLLEPCPRLKEGRALALSKSATSMMDNSDGLALSLFDLAKASGVGFLVREDRLPIDPDVEELAKDRDDLLYLALHAGGDFELVFTVRPKRLEDARNACNFSVIGEVLEGGAGMWIELNDEKRPLKPLGYEHM